MIEGSEHGKMSVWKVGGDKSAKAVGRGCCVLRELKSADDLRQLKLADLQKAPAMP